LSAGLGPRRILLLTDFSAASKPAAEYALLLACRSGTELIALHVIAENGDLTRKSSRVAEEMALQTSRGFGSIKLGQVTPQVQVWTGPLPRTILEVARQVSADLLVMTVDSKSTGHLQGSIAYRVICESECPVLTIPTEARSRR
jgi:nucleotide-binding universal stress UspA family protein